MGRVRAKESTSPRSQLSGSVDGLPLELLRTIRLVDLCDLGYESVSQETHVEADDQIGLSASTGTDLCLPSAGAAWASLGRHSPLAR